MERPARDAVQPAANDRGLAPLLCHGLGDAGKEPRAFFPAIGTGRHAEHALLAALDNIGGLQRRQVLQPETGALRLAVAELPGLDALRKFTVVYDEGLGVFVHDRIFDADTLDGSIPERRE